MEAGPKGKWLPSLLYGFALVLEAILLSCGFYFAVLGTIFPKDRLVGVAIFFPCAALVAWWAGWLSHDRRQSAQRLPVGKLPPIRLFFWTTVLTVVVWLMTVSGIL